MKGLHPSYLLLDMLFCTTLFRYESVARLTPLTPPPKNELKSIIETEQLCSLDEGCMLRDLFHSTEHTFSAEKY